MSHWTPTGIEPTDYDDYDSAITFAPYVVIETLPLLDAVMRSNARLYVYSLGYNRIYYNACISRVISK